MTGIWYSLVWRAFLQWGFSPGCQQAADAQKSKAVQVTQILVVSALSATLQKALVNYFSFFLGPVQLKNFEVFKLSLGFHIWKEEKSCEKQDVKMFLCLTNAIRLKSSSSK